VENLDYNQGLKHSFIYCLPVEEETDGPLGGGAALSESPPIG